MNAPGPAQPHGVLVDGHVLATAMSNGSWVAGGLGAFAFSPDEGPDPLEDLHGAGLGWLVQFLDPLPSWLADLTADTEQVRTFCQDWAQVALAMSTAAGQMDQTVAADLAGVAGDAADAYRSLATDVSVHVEGAAAWAEGISSGLQTAVTLQASVRGATRDALDGIVTSVLAEHAAGASTAALVEHTTALTVQAAEDVGASITALVGSLRELGGLMTDLTGVLGRAQVLFDAVPRSGRRGFHDSLARAHTTALPDISDVPHPCATGEVGPWAATVAARHGTLSAEEVTAVHQYTRGDTGADTPGLGAPSQVGGTLAELARLPETDLRTVHTTTLDQAETVRLGQQLPPGLLTHDQAGNAQVHVDWKPGTDSASLSHYRDEAGRPTADLEVVARHWNPAESRWEIFARQR